MKTIKTIFVILLTAFVAACGGGGGGAPGGNSGGGSSGPIYTVTTLNLNPLTLATPSGLSIDTNGNLYVADTSVDLIKKIQNLSSNTPSVSSVLGGGGTDYNTCSGSKLYSPYGVAVDSAGTLYVAERNKTAARYADCTGSPGVSAQYGSVGGGQALSSPSGIALSGSLLYVADTGNKLIRKITSNGLHSGTSSTFAGVGTDGYVNGDALTVAAFSSPTGIAASSSGDVFVTDTNNCVIRKISAGQVSTLAGAGPTLCGSADGSATAARFDHPTGIALDPISGNLYVADTVSNKIRRITPQGVVTTIAGSGVSGSADGTGSSATFNTPTGIAVDTVGNLFVSEYATGKIRKITVTP
jgi:sugar lactone lactonase YvrE